MKLLKELFTHRERCIGVAAAILLVILVGYFSLHRQYAIENEEARTTAETHASSIYSLVNEITAKISSLSTLYRVSTDVGSDELEQYTEDTIDVSDSIASIGRFDRILKEEISGFSLLMRERGVYRFEIKSLNSDGSVRPSSIRTEHNAVVNIIPFTPKSARLIGVDLSNDDILGSRLSHAVEGNKVVLTGYPTGWPKSGNVLLILPTYAGRYTPSTVDSRLMQNDGGYFLELSFEHFLLSTDSIQSQLTVLGQVLHKSDNSHGGYRAFRGIFDGHRTVLSPLIGSTPIVIEMRSPDGVSVSALINAVFWILCSLAGLVIVLLLLINGRRSEHTRRTTQLSLENERKIALTTLEAINDSVFTLSSSGIISYVNPAAEAMVKKTADMLIGRPFRDSIPFGRGVVSQLGLEVIEKNLTVGAPADLVELELSGIAAATQVDCTFSPFGEIDSTSGGVLVMRDVGKERALNRKLEHLATHDSLTGLVNRYLFEQKLGEMVLGAQENAESHAVCYIDLDQFKIVNDTCGHSAGDKLLIQVANTLKDNCRPTDILARLGGDEFGLLIRNSSEQECEAIARGLHEVFQSLYFVIGEHKFSIRACFGFVPISRKYEAVSDVLAAADLACYSAKDMGRNELHIFRIEGEETSQMKGEMLLLPKLQKALAMDRFVLFVQPIAEILPDGTNDTSKYEILLRMEDDDGSLITPFQLIKAAERYDLMKEIDRWVINRAFHDIAELHTIMGDELPMFSINLSGQSATDGDLIGYIQGKVTQTRVPTEKICFEITETSAIGNLSRAMVLLDFLHDLGCKLALDDFGAGECSFGYLKKLPVDYLKVDGQFVKDVDTCEVHREVLRFVQRVAKLLDIKTVAEFVESEKILDCLRDMDIDYAQGYHISKPFHMSELMRAIPLSKAA